MALGGPNIYPGVLTWLGVGRELTAGTPVQPAITHPLDQGSFEPEDTPKFLQDKAIRGSMTDLFYETLGVESATFSFGGPNFLDSHGYFFDNVFGDLSTTGSTPTNPGTINANHPAIGATSMTLTSAPPSAYSATSVLQIGTGANAEVVVISSTAASNVVNFANNPLRFAHGADTVNTVTSPYTHKFAALNSQLGYGGAFGAQPPTHTFTDVTNIAQSMTSATFGTAASNLYGARWYPFSCLKNIDFSGNAEQILGIKMSGDSFLSSPVTGTAPSLVTTNARPVPNWNSTVNTLTLSGATAASTSVGEFSVSFKRQTQVYWTITGQTPLVIARGPLTMDGTINYDPTTSELPLDLMLLNAQGGMSIVCTNAGIPNAGTPFTLTFTASQVANVKSKIMRSKALIGYQNSFEGIANSTDVGGSGGLGPGTITLINATPTY